MVIICYSKWPNPLNDAETALGMIREHSEDWGVDLNKIAVIGFSAGGHLAAALATLGKVKPNANTERRMFVGYWPLLANEEAIKPALSISLRLMSHHAKDTISPEMIKEVEEKLNQIKCL